jgi:pimeloyl-ACP methyl ester carboxylesterase
MSVTNPWEQEPSKSGLISLGSDHVLHATISGPVRQPNQPLVIIIPGLAASAAEWATVHRLITPFARALLYDRSGYGLSSEATGPITAVSIATELDNLLRIANVPGPFVMVCHSYGGIIGREFLHLRGSGPDGICGMVFVDANQERNTIEGPWPAPYIDSVAQGLDVLDAMGIRKNHQLSPDEWQAYLDEEKTEKHHRTEAAEAAGYRESGLVLASKKQLRLSPPLLNNCPVSVLKGQAHADLGKILAAGDKAGTGTAEEREKFREILKTYDIMDEDWQKETLSLSSRSRWTVTYISGHNVQLTEPDLITKEIQWVLSNL